MTTVVRSALDPAAVAELEGWVAEVEAWPAGSHVWGHYAERTATGCPICRTENVAACHAGVAALVDGLVRGVAVDAAGVPVTAFKDKVNYKHPGGAGFSPHQDVLAYPGARRVISILIAIDECTTDSGCLWMAEGVDRVLPTDERGVVRGDVAASLSWSPIELAPGDAVRIDGLAPHKSDANHSARRRRVLVASYAPASEGYDRGRYYAARAQAIARATAHDGRSRISALADFDGTAVIPVRPSPSPGPDACTHG